MNILGVIPARAGSKGVPGKNLLEIGGKNLIERAVISARESRRLTRTVFSTESEEYAAVAQAAGAETPFLRPPELATDTSGTWDVMRHAIGWLEQEDQWKTDILVVLQPTTPFRTGHHIDATIALVVDGGAEVALGIREVDYPPHWMMAMADDGALHPLIADGNRYPRRQDAPKAYQPSGVVYVLPRHRLEFDDPMDVADKRGHLMSYEESVNIDDWWQVELARSFAGRPD